MSRNIKRLSLRDNLLSDINYFLEAEGFQCNEIIQHGMLMLINLVSDYYEEGKHLYPEVIVTNDMSCLDSLVSRKVLIKTDDLKSLSFKSAVKLCAPLAVDGWIIFIEVLEDKIKFGVFSTELTETSLSLSRQTMYDDSLPEDATFVHIRCIGQKVVEIMGLKEKRHIYLNLDEESEITDDIVSQLSNILVSDCSEDSRENLSLFFEKLIDNSLKVGHGNLIAVIDDKPDKILEVRSLLRDGIYLEENGIIDMAELVKEEEDEKSNISAKKLRAYSSLITGMLNHDGISLFTTTGKLLGYHIFVRANQEMDDSNERGARSRAFESMKRLGLKACFYKSQDGNMELYEQE